MPRRVLFVIRGKLGDTLVAYATVRSFATAFPGDEVTLFTRSGYARLLAGEQGVRVIGFSSRLEMLMRLFGFWLEPEFDALLVLWGFGTPVKWIGRLVRARRKVYLDGRYSGIFPEYTDLAPSRLQSEPMWRVAKIFEPRLPQPDRLEVPILVSRRKVDSDAIGIAPLADEARRIMSPQSLAMLVRALAGKYPGASIRVFVNPADRGATALLKAGLPAGAEFRFFPQLDDLVREFSLLSHIYCTDTGLYHLAASMGVPATVFYGPTQPWKNMMPGQPATQGIRLKVLGSSHCEEKGCDAPLCIDAAIADYAREVTARKLAETPSGCPLRAFPTEQLSETFRHENTRHKA